VVRPQRAFEPCSRQSRRQFLFFDHVDQRNPRQLFFGVEVLCGWEGLGMVEASGGDVDFVGPGVPFISKGGAAGVAKGSPGAGLRAVFLWAALFEPEVRAVDGDPGNRLRSYGPPAVGAMAIGSIEGNLRGLESHGATVASACDGGWGHMKTNLGRASASSKNNHRNANWPQERQNSTSITLHHAGCIVCRKCTCARFVLLGAIWIRP